MEEDIYKYKGGFSDPVTLALLGASAGFLDPRGGMQGGFQGAMQGLMAGRDMRRQDMMDKQSQAKLTRDLAARQQLNEIVQQHQGGNPAAISSAILASGNPDLFQYATQFRGAMPKVKSTVKGYDESGNPVFHNVMDTGEMTATGIRPAEKMSFQNTGQETLGIDPFTGEKRISLQNTMAPGERERLDQSERQFGMSHGLARENAAISRQNNDLQRQRMMMEMDPEFQAQRAGMIAGAKAQAQDRIKYSADLPRVVSQGEDLIRTIDNVLEHPGFSFSVGKTAPAGTVAAIFPGTQSASFKLALEQLGGKEFLQAYESLKGSGQITEIEGQKAQNSISRMRTANTEEDFIKSANELKEIIKSGMNRAKLRAGQQQPVQTQPQTSSDGWGELR